MRWSEIAWGAALLMCWSTSPFAMERAAQLAVLGILLDVSSNVWLGSFVKAPLVWFVVVGMLFELLHMLHKRRTRTMRNTWVQLERLRGQKDLSTLLSLMLQSHSKLLGVNLAQEAHEATRSVSTGADARESGSAPRALPR